MKEYTSKEIKLLKENSYTLKVTRNKIYLTAAFKEAFWIQYQAGGAPKKIIKDLGYDVNLFRQKQIDSLTQRIKKQALSGDGFTEGQTRDKRIPIKEPDGRDCPQSLERMQNELQYLRQEVEYLKKIIKTDAKKRSN
jgi:hypothetical protein